MIDARNLIGRSQKRVYAIVVQSKQNIRSGKKQYCYKSQTILITVRNYLCTSPRKQPWPTDPLFTLGPRVEDLKLIRVLK